MIDVVVNHYAYDCSSPSVVDYSSFGSFDNENYFHSYCTIDYSDYTNAVSLFDRFLPDGAAGVLGFFVLF